MRALRIFSAGVGLAGILCSLAVSGATPEYPGKPIRIVTGPAATMMDVVGRHLALRLGEMWARPVIVDNRGVSVAPAVAAQAAADGYTLLVADSTLLAVRPNLYRSLPYDPVKDFAPITRIATSPQLLVAHPSVPASKLQDFVEYARRQPRGIDFANAGPATASHLTGELFKQITGVNVVPINYQGGGAALMAIIGGEAKAGFQLLFLAMPHVKAGRVKAYGVTSQRRFSGAPEIPTMAEGGIAAFETTYWFGILAPARTSPAIVAKLNQGIGQLLQNSDVRSILLEQGAEPAPGTPEAFGNFIASETVRFRKVIDLAGIRAE